MFAVAAFSSQTAALAGSAPVVHTSVRRASAIVADFASIVPGQPVIGNDAVATDAEVTRLSAPERWTTGPLAATPVSALAVANSVNGITNDAVFFGQPTVGNDAVATDAEVVRGAAPERWTVATIPEAMPEGMVGMVVPTTPSIVPGQPTVGNDAVATDAEVTRGPQAPERWTTGPLTQAA